MKRVLSMAVCAGLGVGLSAASLLAAPPIVDRLPDDAVFSVVIPAPETLQKNASALATAINAPIQVPGVKDMLGMMGITAGVDTTKAVALAFYGPTDLGKPGADVKALDWSEGEKRFVLLVPVTAYGDFLTSVDPQAKADAKISTIVAPDGSDLFVRDAGQGYAVLGGDKALVEAYTGRPGAAPLKSRMGKGGEALADASDLITIINMDRLRPAAEQGIKEAREQAKAQMAVAGPAAAQIDKNLDMVNWIADQVVRDTQVLVGGVKLGTAGVSLDMVGAFKPDSYLARAFSGSPKSGPLLSRLPAGPYLWAGALDISGGAKAVWKDIIARADVPGGDKAKAASTATAETADGFSAVVGMPVGGLMAGILTSTVSYTASKNPDAAVKAFKDSILAADGAQTPGTPVKMASKYAEGGAKVGDAPVDVWELKIQPAGPGEDNEAAMQQQQAMAFMFGAQAAPAGYVAKTEGGFYTTYVKSSELLTKALGAGKGDNLAADAQIKQTQELLPQNRVAEAFVGTRSILDLALPLMAMGGMQVPQDEIPEKLAPIGAAISNQDGAMRMTIAVPAGVLKAGMSLGTAFQEAQEQGQNGGNARPGREGTGQPKF